MSIGKFNMGKQGEKAKADLVCDRMEKITFMRYMSEAIYVYILTLVELDQSVMIYRLICRVK